MRWTTMLAVSAGLLLACGPRGGSGESAATAVTGDPNRAAATPGGAAQSGAESVPFGPRSQARRTQDSVLRVSGPRQRQKVRPDST